MNTSTKAKALRLRDPHAAATPAILARWPTPQEYNEAVQTPRLTLSDDELSSGEIVTNALGLPRAISGSFASVYRIDCTDRAFALRCFLLNTAAMEWRYGEIARTLRQSNVPYTIDFDYQPAGIRIGNAWYPLLKMEWCDGETLDVFLQQRYATLDIGLCEQFKQLHGAFRQTGVAHGDLQHANIMVRNSELRLVDYDCMYVPSMEGCLSNELGHRNYQHPKRGQLDFGSHIDNFSAWIIYLSLKAIAM